MTVNKDEDLISVSTLELQFGALAMRSASPRLTPIQAGSSFKLLLGAILSIFCSTMGSVKTLSKRLLFGLELSFCTTVVFGTFTLSAFASPLPTTAFNQLALSCAPGVELQTLRAVAAVESHFNPLAVRDNSTHESLMPQTLPAAIKLARNRAKKGHSVDIGLMQINNHNLASLGMSLEDAFDECRSLAAGARILLSAFAIGSSESERQAAIMIALSRYNTGGALAGIANGYASQVFAVQRGSLGDRRAQQDSSTTPKWDVWGTSGADPTSWVVTANGSSEIERAGAQTSDARTEGRAPALPSERGEPYELSAYQESEPSKP